MDSNHRVLMRGVLAADDVGDDSSARPRATDPTPHRRTGGSGGGHRRLLARGRRHAAAADHAGLRPARPRRAADPRVLLGRVLRPARADDRAHHVPALRQRRVGRLRPGRHDGARRLRSDRPGRHVPVSRAHVPRVGHELPRGRRRSHPVGAPQRGGPGNGRLPGHPAGHATARLRGDRHRRCRSRSTAGACTGAERSPRRATTSSPSQDGSYFPCMIAAQVPVGGGDSGGVVLVRGYPGRGHESQLRRMARLHPVGRGPDFIGPGAVHHARLRTRGARDGSLGKRRVTTPTSPRPHGCPRPGGSSPARW